MNKNNQLDSPPSPLEKMDSGFLGPCVVAAVVWLALALYMQVIVPAQLDLLAQEEKPEQLRAALPAALQIAVSVHSYFGTSILSLVGLAGCGMAYVRRSSLWANVMIVLGVLLLGATVWVVLVSMPKA